MGTTMSSIQGGYNNLVYGYGASIIGGMTNSVRTDGQFASIGGGYLHSVWGDYGSIGGGGANKVLSNYGHVSGGFRNKANGRFSTIIGGAQNTVNGRYFNGNGLRCTCN